MAGKFIYFAIAPFRRTTWRLARRLYCVSRGEPQKHDIASDGEEYVQRCVLVATQNEHSINVADIGANRGDWSLSFLNAHAQFGDIDSTVQLHLFEPEPNAHASLQGRFSAPASATTRLHLLALSDSEGSAKLARVAPQSGRNTLVPGADTCAKDEVDVRTTTLSIFCRDHGIDHLQLVKTDTEGHDLAVMRGARDLLASGHIDVYQFEYNHTWVYARAFLRDVFELTAGLPYRIARLRPASIEILNAWHPELERFFHANYLLVREPALEWFDVHYGNFDERNTYA